MSNAKGAHTHTHTINSDGDSTPDQVVRWYREHGYQFLVLTDHNFLASATYEIKGDEGYVRARVIGSNGRMAWAQPTVVPGRAASGRD